MKYSHNIQYAYKHTPEKRIDENTLQMASVEVTCLENHKVIGTYSMSKYENVLDIVKMLVREYELKLPI